MNNTEQLQEFLGNNEVCLHSLVDVIRWHAGGVVELVAMGAGSHNL